MMIYHPNPLNVAQQAQNMAKGAGGEGQMFQKVALVSMIVVAAAGATHMMLQIIRELHRDDRQRSR